MIPEELTEKDKAEESGSKETGADSANTLLTFGMNMRLLLYVLLTCLTWLLIRAIPLDKQHNQQEVWDVSFACCGLAGAISLILGEWGAVRKKYMEAWMWGMMIRGSAPMLMLAVDRVNHTSWESRGIFVAITVAFLLTLFLETVLSVYLLRERYPRRTATP